MSVADLLRRGVTDPQSHDATQCHTAAQCTRKMSGLSDSSCPCCSRVQHHQQVPESRAVKQPSTLGDVHPSARSLGLPLAHPAATSRSVYSRLIIALLG